MPIQTALYEAECSSCQDLTTVRLDIKALYDYQMIADFISISLAIYSV